MRLAITAALALAAASAAAPLPPWTARRLLDAPAAGALCLDGSPPLYYVSPGWGSGADKWQLHHEGGAWCGSAEECVGWWGFRSTLVDPDVLPADAQAATGYFNRSSPTNAMFNWNFVFIRYCDGWSFASDRAAPSFVNVTNSSGSYNVTVHFRGAALLAAVRADLLDRGMASASTVVVGGCSAGGLSVYIHCDEWTAAIRAANPATQTVCLADSGWFPIVPAAGFPSTWFNGVWSGGFAFHNASGSMHADCLAAQPAGDEWRCMMAEVVAPFIKTPLFAFQSQYDSFQIFNMERCIPMPPDPTSPCSLADVTRWGGNITARVRDWLASANAVAAGSSALVDSCYHHCGTWADFDQVESFGPAGNVTGSVAFGAWLERRAAPTLWTQPASYPCDACCGAHGPDS